jgi:DNA polymerase-1
MDCSLSQEASGGNVCVVAKTLTRRPSLLVVTKFPSSGNSHTWLENALEAAGFDLSKVAYTGAVKCRAFESQPGKTQLKACKPYLEQEINLLQPKYIMTLGNEALQQVTGHSGIMKYRGKMIEKPGLPPIFPTIAASAAQRAPSQEMGFHADLRYLANLQAGLEPKGPAEGYYTYVDTKEKLALAIQTLKDSAVVSFDVETKSFDEYESNAHIVSLAITCISTHTFASIKASTAPVDVPMTCFSIPLRHIHSPWRRGWRRILGILLKHIRNVRFRVGHNAKFDCRWLKEFDPSSQGVPHTFDTMLAAHLLNENRTKGLKPLARFLLGAPEWDIKISGGRNAIPWYLQHDLEDICKYNGLDTWYTMQLYWLFRQELLSDPKLVKVFTKIMMPASNIFVDVEQTGVWTDVHLLESGLKECTKQLERIDNEIYRWIPDHTPMPVNLRPSNFLRWFLYEHLQLPILQRGKPSVSWPHGNPSVAETVISHLREYHPVVPFLLERVGWQKYRDGFFVPYLAQLTPSHRIRTTFKLTGTVTGRLSSGKADIEKVTGAKTTRGVNLQQVPRDLLVRSCFGAPPGSTFVQADYSQVELRIAAYLAQEPTMLHLYQTGQDIHTAMAQRMTGRMDVSKEERKMAKAVNFGFLYGMREKKFVETAFNNYGLVVNEIEAQAARRAFFAEFPLLVPWHVKQRRLVRTNGRVQSPLGRIRHLPDIYSPDRSLVAEAERQAINSPVQSFASDLTLLSLILITREIKRLHLRALPLGTVHDAINFEVDDRDLHRVLPLIKRTMETLPLEEYFGIFLNVPIVADVSYGTRWGQNETLYQATT